MFKHILLTQFLLKDFLKNYASKQEGVKTRKLRLLAVVSGKSPENK